MSVAVRRWPTLTRWFLALVAVIGLSGCAMTSGVHHDTPARVMVADAPSGADRSAAPLAANAVLSQGRGGYQRTTVPPEFLVLMLGVPLIILLL